MDEHDTGYKLLFSHNRMVRDLLTGFLPEEWASTLDLDSLEKMNGSYVTDDLRSRHGDAVWRLRWGEDWLYVYLLLEFQSSVDRFMALRILVYTGLLHQDLIRRDELGPGRQLPPVLPVVLYNGERRWRAPTEVRPLIHPPPEGLRQFQPNQAFLLIDEGAYASSQAEGPLDNLVAALFRLEHPRSMDDMAGLVRSLVYWLSDPEQASLRRAFLEWLQRRLPRWFGDEPLPEMHDLQEAYVMLSNRFEELKEQYRLSVQKEAMEQGLEQGLEQGRLEGERILVLRLIQRRFGTVPPAVHQHLQNATQNDLEAVADRILDARHPDDLL